MNHGITLSKDSYVNANVLLLLIKQNSWHFQRVTNQTDKMSFRYIREIGNNEKEGEGGRGQSVQGVEKRKIMDRQIDSKGRQLSTLRVFTFRCRGKPRVRCGIHLYVSFFFLFFFVV